MAGFSWIVQTAALFLLFTTFAVSSSTGGRTLLQQKKDCPISFEMMNYTDLTRKCKGPDYPVHPCCDAFKEFACPHAEYINDGTSNCATIMFSYINLNGKYPPGLFANQCAAGKEGLECPPAANTSDSSNAHWSRRPSSSSSSSIAVFAIIGSALGLILS